MVRPNRVSPYGELLAVPDRGMFWGNRGVLVDDRGELTRYSRGTTWAICLLEFRGRRRVQWQPRRITELYFLDEATALAAGHRPCGECRYQAYQEFKRCWALGQHGPAPGVHEIDTRLHADRLAEPRARRRRFAGPEVRRRYPAAASALPDGTMIDLNGVPFLVAANALRRWSPGGYTARQELPETGTVQVITPRATVAALAAGYRPVLHPSATG